MSTEINKQIALEIGHEADQNLGPIATTPGDPRFEKLVHSDGK